MWGQGGGSCPDRHRDRDHPHACGDKRAVRAGYLQLPGSSPRVWGQVIILLRRSYRKRIIPTRVGTRLASCALNSDLEDHPHACGDKNLMGWTSLQVLGSSPRVWGQDKDAFSSCSYDRIIPTRVGTRHRRAFHT